MSATRIEFYATPHEQRRWLRELVRDQNLWISYWRFGETGPKWTTELESESINFSTVYGESLVFFIGNRTICDCPIWRTSGRGEKEMDMIRSRAIQFVPSLVVNDSILLEGRMAIMRKADYDEAGVDPKPIQVWFLSVVRSFRALRSPNVTLVQHTTRGSTRKWRDVVITPGAVAWHHDGKALKQFPEGIVEFRIEASGN